MLIKKSVYQSGVVTPEVVTPTTSRLPTDYKPTRGKADKPRDTPDSILRAVEKGGAIQLDTLTDLLELLHTKTDYAFHVAVEGLPTGSALRKTIDNERDAKETIRRLKEKP